MRLCSQKPVKKGAQDCGDLKSVALLLKAGWCAAAEFTEFSWVLLSCCYLSLHGRAGICHELHCANMALPGTEGADVLHWDRTVLFFFIFSCDCADELVNSRDLPRHHLVSPPAIAFTLSLLSLSLSRSLCLSKIWARCFFHHHWHSVFVFLSHQPFFSFFFWHPL